VSDWRKKHIDWQRRVMARTPDLAARTFALRSKPYRGCGFHYSLEKTLGSVIKIASDLDGVREYPDTIIDQVIVEQFHKELAAAERSLAPIL